jgi:flagellar biosynthesis anti-sigma factor FlgM
MRIDPNQPYLNNVNSDAVENKKTGNSLSGTTSPADGSSVEGGDTVQLSGTLAQVQQLKVQLAQTPDVRTDRVNALRQQVLQGTYAPTNDQIAGAMMSEIFGSGMSR